MTNITNQTVAESILAKLIFLAQHDRDGEPDIDGLDYNDIVPTIPNDIDDAFITEIWRKQGTNGRVSLAFLHRHDTVVQYSISADQSDVEKRDDYYEQPNVTSDVTVGEHRFLVVAFTNETHVIVLTHQHYLMNSFLVRNSNCCRVWSEGYPEALCPNDYQGDPVCLMTKNRSTYKNNKRSVYALSYE